MKYTKFVHKKIFCMMAYTAISKTGRDKYYFKIDKHVALMLLITVFAIIYTQTRPSFPAPEYFVWHLCKYHFLLCSLLQPSSAKKRIELNIHQSAS